ncbi:SRPBCC family protein [Pseudoroseicyclus tamaricis]|uniref:SRPBCC family protein n=1 Tax=Pseudoroseicyclus tamaricis TaxID=2705421 RepID=A0A6B2JYQ6_9RHOB|nr:SRPBCC family protein [Pseudoroseicyclus tamaricis]NDV01434.1 SRPBCC family protein [Pseudoroseicyclus tamaricis]
MRFADHLGHVERSVVSLTREGREAKAVTLARPYNTDAADLWEVLTSPERLPRWFAPVEGEFKLGGRFKVQGNAGGKILECAPPRRLELTWEMGEEISWVSVTLEELGPEQTRLTLVHTAFVSPFWDQFGPGAVGVGWDLALLGLALHLSDPSAEKPDESSFHLQPDGRAFITGSAESWGTADEAGGESADNARRRAAATAAFYTGEQPPGA